MAKQSTLFDNSNEVQWKFIGKECPFEEGKKYIALQPKEGSVYKIDGENEWEIISSYNKEINKTTIKSITQL